MTLTPCSNAPWENGHVSICAVHGFLSIFTPAVACLLSLAFIVFRSKHPSGNPVKPFGFQALSASSRLTLPNDSPHRQYHTLITPPLRLLEVAVLSFDCTITAALLIRQDDGINLLSPFISVYLIALVVARDPAHHLYKPLQSSSALLYVVEWLCITLTAHAAVLEGSERLSSLYHLVRLGLFTALVILHGASPMVPSQSHNSGANGQPLSLQDKASIFSQLAFSWTEGQLWRGLRSGSIEAEHLDKLSHEQTSAVVLSSYRGQIRQIRGARLLWQLYHFLKVGIFKQGLWAATASVIVFVPPMLIGYILEYLEHPELMLRSTAWICVLGLFVSGTVAGLADAQCGWRGNRINAKVRAVLLNLIHGKMLRKRVVRSPLADTGGEEAHATDGTILNLVSGDVDFIGTMSGSLYLVWVTFPVQITLGTCLLYKILGFSGVLGVVLMVALLAVNIWVSKHLAAVQSQLLSATDARIHTNNEVLRTVRSIKYYGWEIAFRDRILATRATELGKLRSRFVWWSVSMTVFYSLPYIATLLTFLLYTGVYKHQLRTTTAFPALATFSVLRIPLNRLADSITFLIQAYESLLRVERFLREPESEKYDQLTMEDSSTVGFDNATLSWPRATGHAFSASDPGIALGAMASGDTFILKDLSINFRPGALNVVCGPSGSGKSSILLALLGEMHLSCGRVLLPYSSEPDGWDGEQEPTDWLADSTAYCPHEAWIMNRSIMSNILLGLPFDGERYSEVVEAVALGPDLASFADSDQALAGDHGRRLSGGQKQRVALARALYSPSKVILLDDCLSAVDSRTANHILAKAIRGRLMQGRTCVFATHHVQFVVPHAEYVVLLDQGRVKAQGTTKEITATGLIGKTFGFEATQPKVSRKLLPADSQTTPADAASQNPARPTSSEPREAKLDGAVPFSTVRYYFSRMGPASFWALVLCGFAVQQIAALGTNLWIKEWAFQYDKLGEQGTTSPTRHSDIVSPWYYLAVYAVICAAYALVTFARDMITFWGSIKASLKIYEHLLDSVLFAKLSFFDRPLGQITNRFVKDVAVVDQMLASFSVSALQIVATVAMIIALILWALPSIPVLVALVLAFFAYYLVINMYISGARDLKRIEAIARSPLYQHIEETIAGCVSVRSYRREAVFSAQNDNLVDKLNQPFLLLSASKQWLTLRINFFSSAITFVTSAFIMLGSAAPGIAGLVLTHTISFTENMLWFAQIYAIIQENFTSLERILEYTKTEQEIKVSGAVGQAVPYNWPQHGELHIQDFTARYASHLPPVLKGINIRARAGERVAIVGRTGAGKSSIMLALLRALEPDSGSIQIDGVDISDVPLDRLRGDAVTVVPQDALLFEDSVRMNLDPLGQYSDDHIASLLHLMEYKLGLEKPASELSRGQRQILCVTRGLLRNSPILVLDEATASVDAAADAAIQAGLRSFSADKGVTIITIAHRLLTIADYNQVIVLDEGRVMERGTPKELLKRKGDSALFRQLCEESGDLEAISKAAQ
ncbi:ATP-dependent bile acid permease [Apiospora arundinis]